LLVVVLCVFDRLMSQTADENIPSSAGMFQCSILLVFLLYLHCIWCDLTCNLMIFFQNVLQ